MTMEISERARLESAKRTTGDHDVTIMLGYAAFAIMVLTGIYWASVSSGITDFSLLNNFAY